MSGFPARPSRAAFGPTYENKRPVGQTSKEVGQGIVNLFAWQVAGCGLVVPLAWVLLDDTGTRLAAVEAWDPQGTYEPVCTMPAPGHYRIEYAGTYPDENGTAVATALIAASPSCGSGNLARKATWSIESNRIVHVYCWSDAQPEVLVAVDRLYVEVR